MPKGPCTTKDHEDRINEIGDKLSEMYYGKGVDNWTEQDHWSYSSLTGELIDAVKEYRESLATTTDMELLEWL